jgi:hypothetical protein
MMKFYCTKCKKKTETVGEVQGMTDSNRHRLHGDCADCDTRKNTLTGKDWVIKKKSEKEEKTAKAKKEEAKFIRQCKELGLEILQSDKACRDCVFKCLGGQKHNST